MGIWVTLKVGHQSLSLNATVTGQSMSKLNASRLTFSSPILLHLPHRLCPWTGVSAAFSCYSLVLKPQCQKFLVHIGGGRFARQNTMCLVKSEVHVQCGHTYLEREISAVYLKFKCTCPCAFVFTESDSWAYGGWKVLTGAVRKLETQESRWCKFQSKGTGPASRLMSGRESKFSFILPFYFCSQPQLHEFWMPHRTVNLVGRSDLSLYWV